MKLKMRLAKQQKNIYDGSMIGVSIVIPCFKRLEQTKKTLTLLYQSNGWNELYNPEVIIADSSPDQSIKEMVSSFKDPTPVYKRPEKPGIAANKNAGAEIAINQILIFCDSDMEVEPETILKTIQSLQKHSTCGAVGGRVIWRGGPNNGQLDRPRPEDLINLIGETAYVEAIYSRFIATYKSVFEKVGKYDEVVFNMRGEGSDLSIRYWRSGFPLVHDPSISVHHVHDAPDSAALRVNKPELAVAKDLFLLGYKYNNTDNDSNFVKTVAANFKQFGDTGYFKILEGIKLHLGLILESKPTLDAYKDNDSPLFPFVFLEIFSNNNLFKKCIQNAPTLLDSVRSQAFS